jgi:predicted metalloendopeptidase
LFRALEFDTESAKLIVNSTPEFFEHVSSALHDESLETWKVYLKWHVIHRLAPLLSERFVQADFELKKVLTGVKELQPRWKRVIQVRECTSRHQWDSWFSIHCTANELGYW